MATGSGDDHGQIPKRTFQAGETIFCEGDDPRGEAFLIHTGRVEVRRRIDGEDRRVRLLGRGDLLGELALFRGAAHSASAVAIESVTVLVIPAGQLYRLVRTRPGLAVALIRQLAVKLGEAERDSPRGRRRTDSEAGR
ncbi:MAG TPA: cyclic nucleotide-binding domain-containing protein [Candidatus Limnocylindrales bacterium]|nr:cyclic nucleotide-binding domain-containing protein [Candidatus Limnocylindrales bacterium]